MKTLFCILVAAAIGVAWLGNRPMSPGVLWAIFALVISIFSACLAAVVMQALP